MSRYISPAESVALHLADNNIITNGQFFVPYAPSWSELPNNVNVIVQLADVNMNPNPVYLYDDCTVQFNVQGRSRNDLDNVSDKAWQIYNFLLGIHGYERDGYWFGRYLSNSSPALRRVGFNTEVFSAFSFSFLRQGLANEGNRVPMV